MYKNAWHPDLNVNQRMMFNIDNSERRELINTREDDYIVIRWNHTQTANETE